MPLWNLHSVTRTAHHQQHASRTWRWKSTVQYLANPKKIETEISYDNFGRMLLFYLFGELIIYRHICIMVVDDILQHFLPPRPGSRLLWKPLHPSPLVWDSQPIACPDFGHLALHHHGAPRVCHGFRRSELARENPPFIDDSLIETSMYIGFLIAMFDHQRVYNMHIFKYLVPYTDEWNFPCWWEKLRDMELLSSPQANPHPRNRMGDEWWRETGHWQGTWIRPSTVSHEGHDEKSEVVWQ